ncbi:uncharacterized protein ARMOST_13973 [Armillaria ostoyae]|uniref:Uncharacterized protein n=1 Tax=Armillaria ostoyae TaxID=47428 RepID=A0A284RPD7_ARMOS|nr:uncharacterized protein ARMOST_13973 [Armillaria ostoyae]
MSYSRQIIPDSHYLQIACWWEGTGLHKRFICAVPLLPHPPCPIGVLQSTPLHIDTQAHLPVSALMNIARGALGGFYIPSKILRVPRSDKDGLFRDTFHGYNSNSDQEPRHLLSQEELSRPLTGLAGQVLWIKVEGTALAPTKNMVPVSMTSMADTDDEEIRVKNRTAYIQIFYPKEARCPFTACLAPKAHHIIDRRHGEAFDVLLSLSHSIVNSLDSCYPYTGPKTRITQSTALLHPSFPIPTTRSVELCLLGAPEVYMPANGMFMDRQISDSYDKFRWVIYQGEAFWIHGETCPLFETYGWYPEMLPKDLESRNVQRKPLKVAQHYHHAQLQDLRTVIGFYHQFGTAQFSRVVLEVSGQLPPEKRKAGRHRKRVRYQSDSDCESDDEDEDEDEDDLEEEEADYRRKSMQPTAGLSSRGVH